MLIKVKGNLPIYKSEWASGADLCCSEDRILNPGDCQAIPTGVSLEIPWGYEGQVRSRSGLALERRVVVLNSPGTIDADYRGEIKVILINHGVCIFEILKGMRIAQLVICKVERCTFDVVEELGSTVRGSGGFGSTGKE